MKPAIGMTKGLGNMNIGTGPRPPRGKKQLSELSIRFHGKGATVVQRFKNVNRSGGAEVAFEEPEEHPFSTVPEAMAFFTEAAAAAPGGAPAAPPDAEMEMDAEMEDLEMELPEDDEPVE